MAPLLCHIHLAPCRQRISAKNSGEKYLWLILFLIDFTDAFASCFSAPNGTTSFPLDLIKVTDGAPLFSAEESALVIAQAEEEGVDNNEYESGKYKLGGK